MNPRVLRAFGFAAIAAATPTIVWRVVVGLGATLGTPASWRAREQLPGSGTTYVIGLSVLQLIAALLTLVLIVPGADRVPRHSPVLAGRRFPRSLVVGTSVVGLVALTAICVLSVVHWDNVSPFGDTSAITGWSVLCLACYLAALAWPVCLAVTIVGYARDRAGRPDVATRSAH